MVWEIEQTDQFMTWWDTLPRKDQLNSSYYLDLLQEKGPALGHPYSSGIKGSHLGHLRELRVQSQGKPLRILYAFDPSRAAILLIGGDKTGQKRFYETLIPIAERLYEDHVKEKGDKRK